MASPGCQTEPTDLATTAKVSTSFQPLQLDALPNAIRVNDQLISGGQPDGDSGFEALVKLGVKTVITVDGAQPDVETARRYGLRYVHLPHGYDGISKTHAKTLTKAIAELQGPIYIHCHHGKHRSPAATAVACIGIGIIDTEQGSDLLALAGTNPGYRGLFRAVAEAEPFSQGALDGVRVDFVERAEIPPLAEAMVEIAHHFEHLQRFQENQWRPLAVHPDLDVGHELLMLREQLAEMRRPELLARDDPEYAHLVENSLQISSQLQQLLATSSPTESATLAQASEWINALRLECQNCHQQFRD